MSDRGYRRVLGLLERGRRVGEYRLRRVHATVGRRPLLPAEGNVQNGFAEHVSCIHLLLLSFSDILSDSLGDFALILARAPGGGALASCSTCEKKDGLKKITDQKIHLREWQDAGVEGETEGGAFIQQERNVQPESELPWMDKSQLLHVAAARTEWFYFPPRCAKLMRCTIRLLSPLHIPVDRDVCCRDGSPASRIEIADGK